MLLLQSYVAIVITQRKTGKFKRLQSLHLFRYKRTSYIKNMGIEYNASFIVKLLISFVKPDSKNI